MDRGAESETTAVPPTPTVETQPTVEVTPFSAGDFLVIATDAPDPPFTDFNEFGEVIGFNNVLMENIAALAGFDGYEFVVTPHEGVLESIANHATDDFDAVMSVLIIPETPLEGIAYTDPYLEIGQVLVVLANNAEMQSYRDIQPGMVIGTQANSLSEEAARTVLALSDDALQAYSTQDEALQALIDGVVQGVVLDQYSAQYYTETFPEQLKVAGGLARSEWLSRKQYGIALAADNTTLQQRLNDAISQLKSDGSIERLTVSWLIPSSGSEIDPGESRVGTPPDELVIGMMGPFTDMDPATDPDLISWEVKNNTMSGLFMFNSENVLVPVLAMDQPTVSEDKLTYTFRLRPGLSFADGTPFTADSVKTSINRSARLGSFLVNGFLKDTNDDNFADEDSVQVIDSSTVQITLQAPTAYFLTLLATPPYFPISEACYGPVLNPSSTCGGIGPYQIESWDMNEMYLTANPQWPGTPPPAFAQIRLRFYDNTTDLQTALTDYHSIDIAWTGVSYAEVTAWRERDSDSDGVSDFKVWQGAPIFKSYLIFEQSAPPWSSEKVRQAAAYAIDREAIVQTVFAGSRLPLYSPVPNDVPHHVDVLPPRNLTQARSLLAEEGYSEANPLAITLWYIEDGRYSAVEAEYAAAIKNQLEETDVFQVTLLSAPWSTYQNQIRTCAYPAYIMGWPSPNTPANYLHPTSWTDFFVQNTDTGFCSNYQSPSMEALVTAATEELDDNARAELYAQIQRLWAEELPTLDLTQEPRWAVSLPKVDNVAIDGMGFMHYEILTKSEGE